MLDLSMCKPCPFCGNKDQKEFSMLHSSRVYEWGGGLDVRNVACSCGAVGPDGCDKDEAVKRWNDRAGM